MGICIESDGGRGGTGGMFSVGDGEEREEEGGDGLEEGYGKGNQGVSFKV